MSLLDILQPKAPPKRKGKLVSQARRDLAAEERKAETLRRYEEARRAEAVASKSARMKALNADPAFRAKTSARMKALHADPAFRAKTSARMKALNADPAFRAKTSARMKALNADPAFRAKVSKGLAARHARTLEAKIEKLKADLLAARKAAED